MGSSTVKAQLHSYIDTDKPDKVIVILKQHPKMVNEPLDSSNHTPLLRAVWKSNYTICTILLAQFKANVNLFGGKYTPLMLAAIRGNISILELLIYFKADIGAVNQEGLNAIDLAVLFGQYESALFLKRKSKEFFDSGLTKGNNTVLLPVHYKNVYQAFESRSKKMNLPFTVNYKAFLECLDKEIDILVAQSLIFSKNKRIPQGNTANDKQKQNFKGNFKPLLKKASNTQSSTASGNKPISFEKSQNDSLNMTKFLDQSMNLEDDMSNFQQNKNQTITDGFKKKRSYEIQQKDKQETVEGI